MTNQLSTDGQPVLRLRSSEDLLAAIPFVVGFHPSDSLVAVGFTGPSVTFAARVDLPRPGDGDREEAVAVQVAEMLGRQEIAAVVLVAYGPRDRAEGVSRLAGSLLGERGITVQEVLRVEADRYWSQSCQDPRCCPPEGKRYDAGSSGVAAQATFAGLAALPDRDALERSVAPVGGVARTAMRQATDRAVAQVEEWAAAEKGTDALRRRMVDEGRALLHEALDRHHHAGVDGGDGPRLAPDEVAVLGMLLQLHAIRDEAWVLIDAERRAAHLALWTDVVRRVDPAYAAAPASLLAFAAWQSGNGALAWVALDRALQADPDCSMAHLIGSALTQGAPPVPWPDMSVADVRRMYDRHDLPPDPRRPVPADAVPARMAAPRPPRGGPRTRRRRPSRSPGRRRRRPGSRRPR